MTAKDYSIHEMKTHCRQKKIVEEIMEEAKLSGLNSPGPYRYVHWRRFYVLVALFLQLQE